MGILATRRHGEVPRFEDLGGTDPRRQGNTPWKALNVSRLIQSHVIFEKPEKIGQA